MSVVLSPADAARDLAGLRAQLAAAPEAAALRPLGLGGLALGTGVLARLPEVVRALGDGAAIVADRRPMAGPHGEVKAFAAQALDAPTVALGDEHGVVHADEATLASALEPCAGAGVLVSIGSGTIVDIGKALSARLGGVPHVAVQTAASVNGFADDQSVLLVDGVKRTLPSRWPDRLLIDSDVLIRAPAPLNRAGLGDLIATCTAPADWRLACLVGQDEGYSPFAVSLAHAPVDAVLDQAHRRDREALENLAAALALSGMAMGVAGSTAPCSGMEHTVSHLLEMTEQSASLHGARVGALSVLAALLWTRVRAVARAGGLRALRFPTEAEMEPRVHAAFAALDASGRAGEECWRDYARKLARWNGARAQLETLWERWAAFDAELERLLASPERLVAALRAARAPIRLTQLGVRAETARWALAHCHLMRSRFTVADLAFFMGIWDGPDVDALLVGAARLGAGL
jgi:glycerol-1-phosphate dehydrogenase [NAD(P)+]